MRARTVLITSSEIDDETDTALVDLRETVPFARVIHTA
jgi:hypothetical protein